ncbi:MAG TPA: DUF6152 family protein [Terriglobia bacterium]|nr:DUF6152 family protein [Terriglobia bacterium]
MKQRLATILAAALLILSVEPLSAHHSFAAEYDRSKPLTLTGRVVQFDWVNPHAFVTIEVTSSDGRKAMWVGQTKPPHVLILSGWTRALSESMVMSGEIITMRGFAAKNGTKRLLGTDLTRSDGKTVLTLSNPPKP